MAQREAEAVKEEMKEALVHSGDAHPKTAGRKEKTAAPGTPKRKPPRERRRRRRSAKRKRSPSKKEAGSEAVKWS